MGNLRHEVETIHRKGELDEDIQKVRQRILITRNFETAMALNKLLSKLQYERRVCGARRKKV